MAPFSVASNLSDSPYPISWNQGIKRVVEELLGDSLSDLLWNQSLSSTLDDSRLDVNVSNYWQKLVSFSS